MGKTDMTLKSVHTFDQSHVHLSTRMPVYLSCDRYCTGSSVPDTLAHLPQFTDTRPLIYPHGHDFFEVGIVLEGHAQHISDMGAQTLGRGSVVIVPRGAVHGYECIESMTLVNLFYIAEWLATDLPELWQYPRMVHCFLAGALFDMPQHFQASVFALKENVLRKVIWEIADLGERLQAAPPNLLYMRACLVKVLSLLIESRDQEDGELWIKSFRREVWYVLEEVEYLLGSVEPIDVRRLAASCGMSAENLSRVFRQKVGMTVMQYYQKRRAQKACRLLASRDMTVTNIVHILGYTDYSHFRRQFIRYLGMTPSAFLKSTRSG